MEEILKKHKNIGFSGAVVSHQNGAAQSTMNKLFTMARTMLMNIAIRFNEDKFPTDLWPMLAKYALCI